MGNNQLKKILGNYKKRLISLDSRMNSYFLSTINNATHLDVVKLFNDIKLLDDLKFNLRSNNIVIPKNNNDHKNNSKVSVFRNNLQKLTRNLNKKERETGQNNLYIGYPFLEGKLLDGKSFRGPLVLHRFSVKETNSAIYINLEDDKIINPVLVMAHTFNNNEFFNKENFNIPNNLNYLEYSKDVLLSIGMTPINNDNDFEEIISTTKKNYELNSKYLINQFEIKNYLVLGEFEISNHSVYDDLKYLEENIENIESKSLNDFFIEDKKYYDISDLKLLEELKIKYISPIDFSQRQVVKHALEENLAIEGPPGTGKSQTIVNLIINLVLKNKKILVVSEKMAAIEVVYNRLGFLKDNALIIKNHLINKQSIYDQISNSKSSILYHDKNPFYINKYDLIINRYLESYIDINEKNYYKGLTFKEVLNASNYYDKNNKNYLPDDSIITFIQYINSKDINIIDKLDEITDENVSDLYKNFKRLRRKKEFSNLSKEEIIFFSNSIEEKQIEKLIQYNYYLTKINEVNYDHIIMTKINDKFISEIKSYDELRKLIDDLYLKLKVLGEKIKILNKPIYNNINSYKKLELITVWNELEDDELNNKIKEAVNNKLTNSKRKLNKKEKLLRDYIKSYMNQFEIPTLKLLIDNFDEDELILVKHFVNRNYYTKDELVNLILNSNYVSFEDESYNVIYNAFNRYIKKLTSENINFIKEFNNYDLLLLDYYISSKMTKDDFINNVLTFYIDKDVLIKTQSTVKYFINNEYHYNNVIDSLGKKAEESMIYTNNYVKKDIKLQFKEDNELYNEFEALISHSESKSKPPVKTLFNRYSKPLLTSFPIILTTPDVVSGALPLEKELFDYVIFDEASQLFVEKAVPSIYRGKNIIVAGDSKQLKPSSLFTKRLLEDYVDEEEFTNKELEAIHKESLLEMAKQKYRNVMLQFHYRSDNKDLIAFSNSVFYDNRLQFASKQNSIENGPAIQVIDVENGLWTKETNNLEEAIETVNLVKKIIYERKNNETIGIVTFNQKQQQLIEQLLLDEKDENINKELSRENKETLEDESLFVKNIENVQGDERDIIIFSIAYAKNESGTIRSNFGLLNQVDGENRLNVAITRARTKIYVVKSIKAFQLKVNENNKGAFYLRKYLEYCEYISNKDYKNANILLNSLNSFKINERKIDNEDKVYANQIYETLKKKYVNKFIIKKNIKVGQYLIDFALYEIETNKYKLGIRLDGYSYNNTIDQNEKNFYLQQYLEQRGWKIYRLILTNYELNFEKELLNIDKILNKGV